MVKMRMVCKMKLSGQCFISETDINICLRALELPMAEPEDVESKTEFYCGGLLVKNVNKDEENDNYYWNTSLIHFARLFLSKWDYSSTALGGIGDENFFEATKQFLNAVASRDTEASLSDQGFTIKCKTKTDPVNVQNDRIIEISVYCGAVWLFCATVEVHLQKRGTYTGKVCKVMNENER